MGNKARISKKALRRESCRVAAAFGVRFFKSFNTRRRKIDCYFFGLTKQQVEIAWVLDPSTAQWTTIRVFGGGGEDERYCSVDVSGQSHSFYSHIDLRYNAIMARGLYRLGFEDEMLRELNCPLSAHENLELRLSMPREFWPKVWLDEAE